MAANVLQVQWDKLMETLQVAALRAKQWSKEREGLANMLNEAKATLTAAHSDTQAADQCSRELMGLYCYIFFLDSSSLAP